MPKGSANSTVFEIYMEQILAPSLQAGQIVIMDNLSTHIGAKVRQAIEARKCQLLFLPSYFPDFSPIEEAFSKLKAFLRRLGARTPEALQEAIGSPPHDHEARCSWLVYALRLSLKTCLRVQDSLLLMRKTEPACAAGSGDFIHATPATS